jgi:hypothetical protein
VNDNEIHQLVTIVDFAPSALKLMIIHEWPTYLGKAEDGFPDAIQMMVHWGKREPI